MHTPAPGCFIGVDVAKREVIISSLGTTTQPVCANEPAALRPWLASLPDHACLGMESTGSYHRSLADLAQARGLTVYVLNPRDVHHYARALGRRAKTDRVDAQLIARYLAQEYALLHPWQPPTPAQEHLTQLLKRRAKVMVAQEMLRASLAGLDVLQPERKAVLMQLDGLLAAMDRELKHALQALPQGPARWHTCAPSQGSGCSRGPLSQSCSHA